MEEEIYTLDFAKLENWSGNAVTIYFTEEDIRQAFLMEVRKLPRRNPEGREPFSFLLHTDLRTQYYNQGTFRLVFPDEGEMLVFLVPVGVHPEGGVLYEVVFN